MVKKIDIIITAYIARVSSLCFVYNLIYNAFNFFFCFFLHFFTSQTIIKWNNNQKNPCIIPWYGPEKFWIF